MGIEALTGESVIDVRLVPAVPTVSVAEPENAPECAETVTTPVATPVATPALLTEATLESEESQATEVVMSLEVPSEYVPVACKLTVAAAATEAEAGETRIPVSEAEPGCPPPPDGLCTPLQAARKRQMARMLNLCRTWFPSRESSRAVS